MKMSLLFCMVILSITLGSCSSSQTRPSWCNEVPDPKDGDVFFVGLSAVQATEKGARDDAFRVSVDRVVKYMGVEAMTKWEKALVSYGAASKVIDPVEATRAFERQNSDGITRRLKEIRFYSEKENNGYKNCTLAQIPQATLDGLYQEWANRQKKIAEKKANEAKDEEAKQQWKDAMNFWSGMERNGLIEK